MHILDTDVLQAPAQVARGGNEACDEQTQSRKNRGKGGATRL